MPKVVSIPKVGNIAFPDGMNDQDISQAAGDLHDKAITDGVSKYMESDPALQNMKSSERLKALSGIAHMLETYPSLAEAVVKGIEQITTSQDDANPSGTAPGESTQPGSAQPQQS